MLKNKFAAVYNELSSYSSGEKIFIFFAMFCNFFITMDYAIIRPISNSLFIHSYGAKFFPYAWLAAVPLNFLLVGLYNRFLPRLGYWPLFAINISIISAITLFCAFFLKTVSTLPFIYYVWKEIYVMLLFQQLWSLIHSTMNMQRAKYLYGIFFFIGALGAAIGSIVPGFFAIAFGSEHLLFICTIIYASMTVCYYYSVKHSTVKPLPKQEKPPLLDGFRLIGKSKPLIFILCIVMFMQLAASLIDYQFQDLLEKSVPDKDIRTEYTGRILGAVHFVTMSLQAFGAFLLLRLFGLYGSHLLLPILLGIQAIIFHVFPIFSVISICYISVKAVDFSVFNVIKEMLYIPLKQEEKFRAKSVIDVFVYRTSKAAASCLILSTQFFITNFLSLATILMYAAWSMLAWKFFQKGTYQEIKEKLTTESAES